MDYRTGAIQPAECLRAGWRLVRDRYWLLLAVVFVGLVVGSLAPLGVFMGPMVCGIYACMFRRMRGEEPSFAVLFGGFRHFVQSFVATLVQIVPIMAPAVPINMLMALLFLKRVMLSLGPPWPRLAAELDATVIGVAVGLSTVVIFVLSVLVGTFFMFSYPLIEDRRVSGWTSVKLSARASGSTAEFPQYPRARAPAAARTATTPPTDRWPARGPVSALVGSPASRFRGDALPSTRTAHQMVSALTTIAPRYPKAKLSPPDSST